MPSIPWNEHSAHLIHSVSELYRNSDLTDCSVDVEGKSIEIHKTVLAACSPYFKKLLMEHHAITHIPIKDVTFKDMKLILDFIYYGEADVNITDVSSMLKTAELLEMTSLKQSICQCFLEEFSCNDTSARSINDTCVVSCTNLMKNDTKNVWEEQVQLDSAVLYMGEESSVSRNIQLWSIGDPTKKYLNDFEEVSGKSNDLPKRREPNTCDNYLCKIEKLEEETVNDELVTITFVAVSGIKEEIETLQNNRMCSDSPLRDPLGEYSDALNVTMERNVNEEGTFQNELQVKKEQNEVIDVSKSLTDVLTADNLADSFQELANTKCDPFIFCDQESDIDSNLAVTLQSCHEDCAFEETCDLKIKFESVCQVSGADVKEEKVFKTAPGHNHNGSDGDMGTPPIEPESELLKSGAQHYSSEDHKQEVNEEEHDADTSKINTHFLSKPGNRTPATHDSMLPQNGLCDERKGLTLGSGNNSSHTAVSNTKLQNNHNLVSSDTLILDALKVLLICFEAKSYIVTQAIYNLFRIFLTLLLLAFEL